MVKKKIMDQLESCQIFQKVFERLIYNQLNEFMEINFSKFFTGFRKNHNTQ